MCIDPSEQTEQKSDHSADRVDPDMHQTGDALDRPNGEDQRMVIDPNQDGLGPAINPADADPPGYEDIMIFHMENRDWYTDGTGRELDLNTGKEDFTSAHVCTDADQPDPVTPLAGYELYNEFPSTSYSHAQRDQAAHDRWGAPGVELMHELDANPSLRDALDTASKATDSQTDVRSSRDADGFGREPYEETDWDPEPHDEDPYIESLRDGIEGVGKYPTGTVESPAEAAP